ncbi:hypothetical protein EJ08DRAFT_731594 [Tothia fuscella]|uniref:Uncharacterized protein n=1 Tax=Tothia fuscella TaxID=1048955 RepID=A0A9P4NXN7_9PEZI|nr:hypothetical protein EJ08DRAFT_731594 [Tothia fuscella]
MLGASTFVCNKLGVCIGHVSTDSVAHVGAENSTSFAHAPAFGVGLVHSFSSNVSKGQSGFCAITYNNNTAQISGSNLTLPIDVAVLIKIVESYAHLATNSTNGSSDAKGSSTQPPNHHREDGMAEEFVRQHIGFVVVPAEKFILQVSGLEVNLPAQALNVFSWCLPLLLSWFFGKLWRNLTGNQEELQKLAAQAELEKAIEYANEMKLEADERAITRQSTFDDVEEQMLKSKEDSDAAAVASLAAQNAAQDSSTACDQELQQVRHVRQLCNEELIDIQTKKAEAAEAAEELRSYIIDRKADVDREVEAYAISSKSKVDEDLKVYKSTVETEISKAVSIQFQQSVTESIQLLQATRQQISDDLKNDTVQLKVGMHTFSVVLSEGLVKKFLECQFDTNEKLKAERTATLGDIHKCGLIQQKAVQEGGERLMKGLTKVIEDSKENIDEIAAMKIAEIDDRVESAVKDISSNAQDQNARLARELTQIIETSKGQIGNHTSQKMEDINAHVKSEVDTAKAQIKENLVAHRDNLKNAIAACKQQFDDNATQKLGEFNTHITSTVGTAKDGIDQQFNEKCRALAKHAIDKERSIDLVSKGARNSLEQFVTGKKVILEGIANRQREELENTFSEFSALVPHASTVQKMLDYTQSRLNAQDASLENHVGRIEEVEGQLHKQAESLSHLRVASQLAIPLFVRTAESAPSLTPVKVQAQKESKAIPIRAAVKDTKKSSVTMVPTTMQKSSAVNDSSAALSIAIGDIAGATSHASAESRPASFIGPSPLEDTAVNGSALEANASGNKSLSSADSPPSENKIADTQGSLSADDTNRLSVADVVDSAKPSPASTTATEPSTSPIGIIPKGKQLSLDTGESTETALLSHGNSKSLTNPEPLAPSSMEKGKSKDTSEMRATIDGASMASSNASSTAESGSSKASRSEHWEEVLRNYKTNQHFNGRDPECIKRVKKYEALRDDAKAIETKSAMNVDHITPDFSSGGSSDTVAASPVSTNQQNLAVSSPKANNGIDGSRDQGLEKSNRVPVSKSELLGLAHSKHSGGSSAQSMQLTPSSSNDSIGMVTPTVPKVVGGLARSHENGTNPTSTVNSGSITPVAGDLGLSKHASSSYMPAGRASQVSTSPGNSTSPAAIGLSASRHAGIDTTPGLSGLVDSRHSSRNTSSAVRGLESSRHSGNGTPPMSGLHVEFHQSQLRLVGSSGGNTPAVPAPPGLRDFRHASSNNTTTAPAARGLQGSRHASSNNTTATPTALSLQGSQHASGNNPLAAPITPGPQGSKHTSSNAAPATPVLQDSNNAGGSSTRAESSIQGPKGTDRDIAPSGPRIQGSKNANGSTTPARSSVQGSKDASSSTPPNATTVAGPNNAGSDIRPAVAGLESPKTPAASTSETAIESDSRNNNTSQAVADLALLSEDTVFENDDIEWEDDSVGGDGTAGEDGFVEEEEKSSQTGGSITPNGQSGNGTRGGQRKKRTQMKNKGGQGGNKKNNKGGGNDGVGDGGPVKMGDYKVG